MKKIEKRYVKKDSKEKVPNSKINRNYDWAEESSIKKTEIQNYDYDKEYEKAKIENRYVRKNFRKIKPPNVENENNNGNINHDIDNVNTYNDEYAAKIDNADHKVSIRYVNKRKGINHEESVNDSLVFDNSNIKKENSAISHDKKNYNDNSSYNINHNQSYNNNYRPYPNRYETPSKKSKSNIGQGIKLEFATRGDKEEGVYKKVSDRIINNARNKATRVKTDDRLHFDNFSKQDDVLNLSSYEIKDEKRTNLFDYGWGASKYTSKAPYKVGKGTVKFFLREYTNELRQDDAFKGMIDAKYYMKNYGGLAKNLSVVGLGTALNSSSKFMSMPITFGKTNINSDIQVDKRSINERLNTRLNKRLSKYTKQTDSMYNIDFFKEKNYKNLKKAVKNNKIGRSLNSKKGWTNYLGEKGIDKVNVRKYNLIKRPKNKIKRITLLYTDREFLAGNLKKLEYKRDLKKLNKIQNRRIAVKNSLKLVAGDVFRRTSNTISSDYGNIGLSGFDSTLDVSRNVLKAGKSLAYKPAKGAAIKTGRLGVKGAKNKDKIKKGVKAAGRVANPVPKGKRVYNWVKKHRKIYKDHGLISSIKSVSKDIGRNIINTTKRIFKILRGALTMLFTAFTGTMGFFFLSGLVVVAAVLIIVWSNLNPLTIVKNSASTFQDTGVDAGMDNYGDDIKEHFDYLRGLNEKLDEEYRDYADVVIYLQNPDNSKAIISLISVEFDNDLREHNHVAMRKRMDKYHEDSHRIVDEYYKTHKVGDEEVVLKYIEVETDQEPSDIVGVDNPYERVGSSLSSGGSSGGTSTSTSSVNTTPTGSVKSDFDEVVEELKLSDKEKSEWSYIISRESGWNPSATNPSSGAYGLGQAYPGNKMATHGSDWKTNPKTQLLWMYDYMNGRYGSITGAYNFWRANQWY